MSKDTDTERLERLWSADFGNQYVDRNRDAGARRGGFWKLMLDETKPLRVLEVGCNVGGNLTHIAQIVPPESVWGVDVNSTALHELHRVAPRINAVWAPARQLPLRDRWFDLTFTMGVLIHQPDTTLPLVMSELVRTSRRFVLCGEYYAKQSVEVPYRGQPGALFKRDYGGIYKDLFPELILRREGHLTSDDGFDDVTYWLFEQRS